MVEPGGQPRPRVVSRARRVLRALAWTLAAVVVLAAIALGVVLRQLDARVRDALVAEAARLEAIIGRGVSVGDVHVTVGATAAIVVRDIAVGAAAGATGALAEPPLKVASTRLGIRLGPLLRTWGRSIEITGFEIDGLEVTLVRTPEGLSIDDVRARVAALPPRARPPGAPSVVLDHVAIEGAKLHLRAVGGARGADVDVEPIALRGKGIRIDGPSRLTLTVGAAPGAALEVGVDLAVPAGAAPGAKVAFDRAEVRLAGLRLAPIFAWLPAGAAPSIDLDDAVLGVDAVVDAKEVFTVRGKTALGKAHLALAGDGGARERSAPIDVAISFDASVDPEAKAISVRSLDGNIAGTEVHLRLDGRSLEGGPAVDKLELDVIGDAGALLGLLPAGRAARRVAASGPVALWIRGTLGADVARGTVRLDLNDIRAVGTSAAGHEERGDAARVSVSAAIEYTTRDRRLGISEAEVHMGDLVARGGAALRGIGEALDIESLNVAASGNLEQLVALAPPSRRPPGVALRGPVAATLALHGKPASLAGKVTVDLDRAAVRAGGFVKPAGVRLGAELEGHADGGLAVEAATLRLASIALGARGQVRSAEQVNLSFDLRDAAIEPVIALFPAAKTRLESVTLEGRLTTTGTLSRAGKKTTVDARIGLREARVRRGLASMVGAPEAKVHVEAAEGITSASVDVDLGGALLAVVPVVAKQVGKPARLAFSVTRDAAGVRVSGARVAVPGVSIDDVEVAVAPRSVRVRAAAATISLGPLGETVPLLRGRFPPGLADAVVRFGLDFSGDPDDPAADSLRVTGLELRGGLGHLRGSVEVDGVRKPRAVRFDVAGGEVDLDGSGGRDASIDLSPDDAGDLPISGRVRLDSLRVRGEPVRGLDAEIAIARGRLSVKSLTARAFGGNVVVEPSWVDLSDVPELDVHARVEDIDLAKVGAPAANELRGRATGRVDLHGKGHGKEAMTRSLRGALRFTLRDAHAKAMVTPKITLVNPLLAGIFERAAKKRAGEPRSIDLREASATFELGGGKLTTTEPVVLRSDDLTARLRGTIGLDRTLGLEGDVDVAASAIAAMSKGRLVPLRTIPLKLRVGGAAGDLRLELLDLGDTARALRGAVRNGLLGGAEEEK